MQNLRDKLLKSGLVDKKTAREVRTEQRRQKKQRGARAEVEQEQQRKAQFAAKLEQEAEAAREQAASVNAERGRREHEDRLRNIIERHCLRRVGGDHRKFHFVAADRKTVRSLCTTFEIGDALVTGELAIVAAPHDRQRDYRLVERAAAERIEALAASYLLFWNKQPGEDGPTYGATGPVVASGEAGAEPKNGNQ